LLKKVDGWWVETDDIYESDIEGPCALYLEELGSKGRLNKSESNKAQKLRLVDFKNSVRKRRESREQAENWVGNALAVL